MYDFKLTEKQQRIATEKHWVLEKFLVANNLPTDEFYDVLVFDYLRAVRIYDTHGSKTANTFESIANTCMAKALNDHFRSQEMERCGAEILHLGSRIPGSRVKVKNLLMDVDLCDLICDELSSTPENRGWISHISRLAYRYAVAI